MPKYEAVLFDFDGTLAPNLDLRGMRQDLLSFTLQKTAIPKEKIERLYMLELIDYTAEWLESQGKTSANYVKAAHKQIKDTEVNTARKTQVFPETLGLLSSLRRAGMRVGIVTRNCDEAVRTVFPDLDEHIDAFISRDTAICLKPDPGHLQQCLDNMNCKANKSVMVGDSIMDVQAGAALSMFTVGVLTGSSDKHDFQQASTDIVLESIAELKPLLTS